MINKLLIFFIVILVSFSCKLNKKINTAESKITQEELSAKAIVDSLLSNSLQYNRLFIKFNAHIKSNKMNMNTVGTIKVLKDSLIILSITPVLGIELMRARITKNQIIVLNRVNKSYYIEDINNIYKLLGVNLYFSHLENILVNKLFTYPDSLSISRDYNFEHIFENELNYSRFKHIGTIGDSTNFLHNINILDNDKIFKSTSVKLASVNKSISLTYNDYKELNKIQFPYLVKIETIDGKFVNHLAIEYTKVEPNKDLNFSFSIPKKYKKVKLVGF